MNIFFKTLNRSKVAVRAYIIIVGVPFSMFFVLPILLAMHLWGVAKDISGDACEVFGALAARYRVAKVGGELFSDFM